MSQNLNDDLEEGEIADDIMPEPVLEKEIKTLPRRYVLNERKNTPKHKKNCKHAAQHHNRKNNKSGFFSNSTLPKKHRRACPKHKADWYSNVSIGNFPLASEKSLAGGVNNRRPTYDYRKSSTVKSAFKNFTSPPRKVSKLNNFNCHSSENIDNFPNLLSEYKNSRDELKFKNISNLKKHDKNPSKTTVDKANTLVSKQESSENLPPSENSVHNSDDEDEEELRRIALATCAKRLPTEMIAENVNSCDTKSSTANMNTLGSDNYEVVDMDIDEESENVTNVDNLFVIDTTPTYFGDLHQQTLNGNFGYNLGNDLNTGLQSNGFISSLSIEEPFPNFNGGVINHNLNNDLYLTSFSPILVNESNPPPNQLDEDFEEELLRAELIANINSIRKKAEHCSIENKNIPENKVCVDSQIGIDIENKVDRNENSFKAIRTINLKTDSRKENSFNERIVSIESKISEIEHLFKERTVSIVSDGTKKENARNVSTLHSKHDVPKTVNASKRNGGDIKVKLSNVKPAINSANATANKLILPQERIIISLNNESSSDDSDQEDASQENPVKDSAVASLEALISNARHESDGKKESVANSNISSDALSWLSKAQQEEYNSLMKILAKKQQIVIQPAQNEVQKAEAAGLTLLKKKMLIARKNLEKEKELMNNMMKELVKKKRAYMVSKLRTQHLKEQLLAAERVRKSNLQLWTKCSSELQTLKKSVSKRQGIINSLESKISMMSPDFDINNVLPISNDASDNHTLPL